MHTFRTWFSAAGAMAKVPSPAAAAHRESIENRGDKKSSRVYFELEFVEIRMSQWQSA